jgi:hypothetical protein
MLLMSIHIPGAVPYCVQHARDRLLDRRPDINCFVSDKTQRSSTPYAAATDLNAHT